MALESVIGAELILKKAIWNENARKSMINQALTEQARVLETVLKDNIDASTPAGRLYSKGAKTARLTAKNKYLPKKKGTTTRVITGYKYHQASAEGQPPARDTSKLYNAIKVRRVVGQMRIEASVKAVAVQILDSPNGLNRPFFRSIILQQAGNGQWDFRQAVKKLLSRLVNEEVNAVRRVYAADQRAKAKIKEAERKAAVRAKLGVYRPPS